MKIHAISNPIRPNRTENVGFGRKLKESEKPQYTKAIHEALDYLGVQNLSMIVHNVESEPLSVISFGQSQRYTEPAELSLIGVEYFSFFFFDTV